MAKTKTRTYDAAEYLETPEDMAAYLEAALEDGEPAVVMHALGTIARARGMSRIARETGLGRESLYKALSPDGNPEFSTVLKVVRGAGAKTSRRSRTCLRFFAASQKERGGQSSTILSLSPAHLVLQYPHDTKFFLGLQVPHNPLIR